LDRKHRHSQWLGGIDRYALSQNRVNRQTQVGVLLRTTQGEHGPIISLKILRHLHPVHFGYAHLTIPKSSLVAAAMPRRSREILTQSRCISQVPACSAA
jgi:hypothetical protein